jgi:hypothetical protein
MVPLAPGKQKRKKAKKRARWRSNLGHRACTTRYFPNYKISQFTWRPLPNGCEPPHPTRYPLIYKNLSFNTVTVMNHITRSGRPSIIETYQFTRTYSYNPLMPSSYIFSTGNEDEHYVHAEVFPLFTFPFPSSQSHP